ncbi:MAG: DHA2 family efflux MFS transporter permease subunit [Pyrinomonadaceae bacterium]
MASVVREPCAEGIILSGKYVAPCTKSQGRWILAATILASSMAFIDGTVVNVAIPFLQKELNATVIGVQWVVEAYALFLSALLLVGGAFGDRYGRKRVFLVGLTLFALASAACGVAANINQLILARAVQGIGGALLLPGSLAIISASFAPDQRGRAIGTWSGFSAITAAVGPVLGGWLIEHVSWRAVFFLNLPLAAAVIVISLWHVPESRDRDQSGPLDWRGAGLATIGLAGVVFGLIESSRMGFLQTTVVAALVIGVVSLAAFVFVEARARNPMVPLSLFRSPDFAGANLLTLLLYAALSGAMFFLTLNLIQVQGFSATAAGAAFLPFILIMFFLSRWSGGLVDRYGARGPLTIGPVVAAVGFAMFALPGTAANYWSGVFPAVCVLGLGMAISVAPLTTTVMSAVKESLAGLASGINNAISRAAALLAIAIFGVVMLQVFTRTLNARLASINVPETTRSLVYDQRIKLAGMELPADLPPAQQEELRRAVAEAFVSGYRLIMIIAACLALSGAGCSWLFVGKTRKTSNGKTCRHLQQMRPVTPSAPGCEDCLRIGDTWEHLRLCMTCGHVGCCDSSKNKHATRHFMEVGHPIIKSFQPDEEWGWCYVDELMFDRL